MTVDENPPVANFDQHRAKAAFPEMPQHAFRCQWQFGLRRIGLAVEDFWLKWRIHGKDDGRPKAPPAGSGNGEDRTQSQTQMRLTQAGARVGRGR